MILKEKVNLHGGIMKKGVSIFKDSSEAFKKTSQKKKKKQNYKVALANRELFESVRIEGSKVIPTLSDKYKSVSCYSINNSFRNLFSNSSSFQTRFEIPKLHKDKIVLELKKNHGYNNAEEILEALTFFAAEKNSFKQDLANGEMFDSVKLEGLTVTPVLNKKYKLPDAFFSINKTLYELFHNSTLLRRTIEKPHRRRTELTTLRLKKMGIKTVKIFLIS